jgi:hypothetical protein
MITSIIGDVLLRELPAALAAGVKSGEYQVYGSIIRSISSGRIVGHLQETGGLSKLPGLLGAGPLAPLKLLSDGVQIVQNEQIKESLAGLEAGMAQLQELDVANLALGAAGLGVSVAGFAILGRKIEGVKRDISKLGERIEAIGAQVNELHLEVVERDMDRLDATALALDEGWRLTPSAAERHWQDVAQESLQVAIAFERRARWLLAKGPSEVETAEPMLAAHSMAISLRVAAWAAASEEEAALNAAAQGSKATFELTGRIGHADIAVARLEKEKGLQAGTAEWGTALTRAKQLTLPLATRLREREAAAATRAAPLADAAGRGLRLRDWMATAREESDVPLLVMIPVSA